MLFIIHYLEKIKSKTPKPSNTFVPMRYHPFHQFVLFSENPYDISHAVVQKMVPRKIREPF